MQPTLQTVTSADGTRIAFESSGDGHPVILLGGAFNDRTTVAPLAAALAPAFRAITYDRRGRGGSGDAPAYAVEREVEDLAALIEQAGGSASVFGHSSGAILALEAAARGLPIARLAVYEPPYVVSDARSRPGDDFAGRLRALVEQDRRDDAVAMFLTEGADVPEQVVAGMRSEPVWNWFTGLAHTLPYDAAVSGPGQSLPAGRLAGITVPTLAIGGDRSPAWMLDAVRAVAEAVPGARHLVLPGQDHGVLGEPEALRPALEDFLA
ncbi:alpha/beta hydrolase [Nonomuraea sp. WAC 01424]|uniref:alpha/beta fold hydrolase n=1 Tax=Nonomuraea sp. WAC 01424 TaxID=2203200 RepID=UPI000F76F311|nr:alpha/beta hydrolase [Nonomuraea sp. WAC 01424]RSM97524.1 alpha/beta hydrolase [Nonomuraea sp. WAC 01424]